LSFFFRKGGRLVGDLVAFHDAPTGRNSQFARNDPECPRAAGVQGLPDAAEVGLCPPGPGEVYPDPSQPARKGFTRGKPCRRSCWPV